MTKFVVGDACHLFLLDHTGDTTPGAVVAVINLPGWSHHHYVVETEADALDPILSIRCDSTLHKYGISDE